MVDNYYLSDSYKRESSMNGKLFKSIISFNRKIVIKRFCSVSVLFSFCSGDQFLKETSLSCFCFRKVFYDGENRTKIVYKGVQINLSHTDKEIKAVNDFFLMRFAAKRRSFEAIHKWIHCFPYDRVFLIATRVVFMRQGCIILEFIKMQQPPTTRYKYRIRWFV